MHVSVIDIAQFASGDADEDKEKKVEWSDFVSFGVQAGLRIGGTSTRIPFVIVADLSWAPRLTFENEAGKESRGAFRFGGMIGFNVPFFDLN